jgi:hypothetical protein
MQRIEPQFEATFATWSFVLFALLAVMALVAVGIGLQVYFRGRESKPARGAASNVLSAIWVVPVLALCAFLGARAVYTLRGGASEAPPHVVATVHGTEFIYADPDHEPALPLPDPVRTWSEYSVGDDEHGSPTHAVVVSSRQYATVDEADEQVRSAALDKIREDFHRVHGNQGHWAIPPELVRDAIRHRYVEPITHTTGTHDFEVYRVHTQLVIDPPLRAELHNVWREQISQRRLWTLGSLLGFATLIVGACAAYLRLDLLTHGAYRRRLKLATVALIAAGGLAAAGLMPIG